MYDELVKSLRDKAEFLDKTSYGRNVHNSFAETMKQAADAIEELSKTRWIPVTERLPDNNGHLVLIRHHSNTGNRFYGLDVCADGRWVISENVTHWMPLPQPPKEEGE